MNDDKPTADERLDALAAEPLDESDSTLLADIADLLVTIDPVPVDLVERVQFALALDEVYDEVAQITRMPMDALAVRGGEAISGTRTETLTFSAERLTAMVTVTRTSGGIRVDGWIAPAGPMEIRLRMQGERRQARADDTGRFVFDELPEGFAQLSFYPVDDSTTGAGASDAVVVTPLFQL